MVDTLKKSIQRMMHSELIEWDECLDKVVYGYRRRRGNDGRSPFEVIFGVIPRLAGQQSVNVLPISTMETSRLFELVMAIVWPAERIVQRSIVDDAIRFKVGDKVLLTRGTKSSGPKINNRLWLGPYTVTAVNHPH